MKAIIIGGGIGGISCALALFQRGWDVQILEQSSKLSENGGGLQISPNGMKVLNKLGVTPYLEPSLFEPEAIEMRMAKSGERIFKLPMKGQALQRWGARYIQIHRTDLLRAMNKHLILTAGNIIQKNSHVLQYEHSGEKIQALLEDGRRIEGDVLIGADGIHSKIRKQMIGTNQPRFTGNYAWRSVVPIHRLKNTLLPNTGCIWAGDKKHVITTRVHAGNSINFVGIVETKEWNEESWSIIGKKEDALHDFKEWDPLIHKIIEQSDTIYRWGLFDHAPLDKWSDGHSVLIGDAAHPMLPSMAQGAVQALEDAYVLAKNLTTEKNIPTACRLYFKERYKRTRKIQTKSARNLRLFHKNNPISKFVTYAPIWLASSITPNLIHRQYNWIYSYDVTKS